ncbi:conserved hypothetical protein [Aspergillus terreus NIH2624]|uniref:UspA domain-containing protein n=1 Tax=Aspergillus terreus (strain NIH 2624 / FGSC A1156) TaxID=341663 RepID=Q0CPJ9_ASPTN|nr:uncharacterized protein ATEG_04385 [Aspergillus terreus NIH2624]EAU34832.1 conserved hypothetical protein [Aspergillus terreus NIH2624]
MSTESTPKQSLDADDPQQQTTSSSRPSRTSHARSAGSPRRKSIQFNIGGNPSTGSTDGPPPRRSASASARRRSQFDLPTRERNKSSERDRPISSRGPSPPPPQTYERGVSFDTFDNPDAADFSLTLNYKHKGYQSTRRSRTFLCGIDQNDYSDFALEWLIDELVDDGDEIVCLRAVEKDSRIASDAGIEAGKYRQEAEKIFEQVIQKNSQDEKAISVVLELAVGKIQDIIQRMIRIYEPSVLIVGTRGRSLGGVQGLLPGSVSKYCLQQSPIPVIVVRPSPKREKKKKKRLADPTRRSYNQILEMSEQRGSRILDANSSTESHISRLPGEEAAVAAALGLPQSYTTASRSSLSMSSEPSSASHDEHVSPSPNIGSPSPAASAETTESDSSTDEEADERASNAKESSTDSVQDENRDSRTEIPVIVTEDMTK